MGKDHTQTTINQSMKVNRQGEPRGLLAYWLWLVSDCPTQPVQLFISAVSLWFFVTLLLSVLRGEVPSSPTLILLVSVMPINVWVSSTFVVAVAKIIGVLWRNSLLCLFGSLGSVTVWGTIAAVNHSYFPTSPVWGAYAIIAVFSSWVFIRQFLAISGPIVDWLRDRRQKNDDVGH